MQPRGNKIILYGWRREKCGRIILSVYQYVIRIYYLCIYIPGRDYWLSTSSKYSWWPLEAVWLWPPFPICLTFNQQLHTYISTYLQTQNAFTKIIRPLITHYTRALMRFRCNGLIQTNLEFATLYYLAKYKNTYILSCRRVKFKCWQFKNSIYLTSPG